MNWTQADIDNFNKRKAGVTPPTATPLQRMQALGRMKAGKMNNTERAYSQLLEAKKRTGEVANYWFEAMNLRIGENCFYKIDFLVLKGDGFLEIHEVKGHLTDDALVKMRAVAAQYPFRLLMYKLVKGEWVEKEF